MPGGRALGGQYAAGTLVASRRYSQEEGNWNGEGLCEYAYWLWPVSSPERWLCLPWLKRLWQRDPSTYVLGQARPIPWSPRFQPARRSRRSIAAAGATSVMAR